MEENISNLEDNIEGLIRKRFKIEETKLDKEYFLSEISRIVKELYREIE